jgi:hypothetical protein
MSVQVCLLYPHLPSFECVPRSGIARSHGGPSTLLSKVVVLMYILTYSVEAFLSPTSSPTFVVVCVLDNSLSSRSEVES